MSKKPYSDPRWWDNPGFIFSLCDSCKYGPSGRCSKYPGGETPKELLDKSFPGTENFDENYCPYREEMEPKTE